MADQSTLIHPGADQKRVEAVREFFLEVEGARAGPFSERVQVGSAQGNALVLEDPAVSRFHFHIERTQAGLLVTDVGSTNGTRVGGHRVVSAYVEEGSAIEVGGSKVIVRVAKTPRLLERRHRPRYGELIGSGPKMQALFELLERLSRAVAPALIEGETGTGKELVARALHTEGPRAPGPFVIVDCGAIAPTLIESELFGHLRGAFTGALEDRVGSFEAANGGTLFLDEIGELPLPLQPKLLRALEAKTIKRLGETVEHKVDVRVIAATHRSLQRMVNERRFREDLYFRLAVCPIELPPLRERPEDLEALAVHFLTAALPEAPARLSRETVAMLADQAWKGNVRELRNAVERAVILGDPERLAVGDLTEGLRRSVKAVREEDPLAQPLEESKRRFERGYLLRLLAKFPKDRQRAAEVAGIHPKSLQRLIRRHGLSKTEEDQ